MKRDPFEQVELTAEESAAIDTMLANGEGRPTYYPLPRTSTPITAEGLRGLGMSAADEKLDWFCLDIGKTQIEVLNITRLVRSTGWSVFATGKKIGTAPDIEAVADLIAVLRRMNGGG